MPYLSVAGAVKKRRVEAVMSDTGERDPLAALERFARLRALAEGRTGAEGVHQSIQAELAKERALSLARAVAKVRAAYDGLDAIRAEAEAMDEAERGAHLTRYDAARESALRARWELLVHREAAGLVHQQDLDEEWPVPPRLR